MKELQRKRHSASPGVSFKGRVRKAAKWKPASDGESDEESESKFLEMDSDRFFFAGSHESFICFLSCTIWLWEKITFSFFISTLVLLFLPH